MPHQDAGTPPTPAVDKGALDEMRKLTQQSLDDLTTPVTSSYDDPTNGAHSHSHGPFSFSALLFKTRQKEALEKGHDTTAPSVEV